MTKKENLLRAIGHREPQWVPNGMESVITIGSPVVERPDAAALDAFCVSWSLETGAEGGTYPTPKGNPISDLTLWREQLVVPDLDAIDWGPAIEPYGLSRLMPFLRISMPDIQINVRLSILRVTMAYTRGTDCS